MKKPRIERTSMISKTFNSRVVSRPAMATTNISVSQPAIHGAALGLDGLRSVNGQVRGLRCSGARNMAGGEGEALSATARRFATRKTADAALRRIFKRGLVHLIGAKDRLFRRCRNSFLERLLMLVLQPAEWSKPRGFSHGVVVDGPGKWGVLSGQTGGDEKGDYAPDLASQVARA